MTLVEGATYYIKLGIKKHTPRNFGFGVYIGSYKVGERSWHIFTREKDEPFGIEFDELTFNLDTPMLKVINKYYNGDPTRPLKFYARADDEVVDRLSIINTLRAKINNLYK